MTYLRENGVQIRRYKMCCAIHVVMIHRMHVSHHRTFTTAIADCCLLLPIEARGIY